jgi:diguanylate cyclase (GGDEF)-like protein
VITREDLAKLALLEQADLEVVGPMLLACPVRDLNNGEVLIEVGSEHRHLFLILHGVLGVHLGSADAPILIRLGAGETVGEISLIDRQPASAYVVAAEPTRVLVVDEDLLWMLTEVSHAVSSNLLRTLAARMRSGNKMLLRDRALIEQYRFHASVDALTGLFNRYWMDKMLTRQMERSRGGREALSILLVDVDHFKRFNDAHGHVAGDSALRCVAGAMRGVVRPTDLLARYGGEEFAVLLPGATVQNASYVAERLRAAVSETAIEHLDGTKLAAVTVSIGVAQMAEDASPERFIERADQALYRAKNAGRNRVELA